MGEVERRAGGREAARGHPAEHGTSMGSRERGKRSREGNKENTENETEINQPKPLPRSFFEFCVFGTYDDNLLELDKHTF